jgi:hypothetical protein
MNPVEAQSFRLALKILALVGPLAVGLPALATDSIAPVDAIKHVGQHVRVCGKVVSAKYAESTGPRRDGGVRPVADRGGWAGALIARALQRLLVN